MVNYVVSDLPYGLGTRRVAFDVGVGRIVSVWSEENKLVHIGYPWLRKHPS